MASWTDEEKDDVIKQYLAAEPTPKTSTEIVKKIADTMEGKTVNGVMAILVKSGKYVKKDPTKAATDGSKPASTRVNKAEAIKSLEDLITGKGLELDDTITSKLTGKAAMYFATVFNALTIED